MWAMQCSTPHTCICTYVQRFRRYYHQKGTADSKPGVGCTVLTDSETTWGRQPPGWLTPQLWITQDDCCQDGSSAHALLHPHASFNAHCQGSHMHAVQLLQLTHS